MQRGRLFGLCEPLVIYCYVFLLRIGPCSSGRLASLTTGAGKSRQASQKPSGSAFTTCCSSRRRAPSRASGPTRSPLPDRKSVVLGKGVVVRLDHGGRRLPKKYK